MDRRDSRGPKRDSRLGHLAAALSLAVTFGLPRWATAQSESTVDGRFILDLLPSALFEAQALGFDAWRLVLAAVIIAVGFGARTYLFRKLVAPFRAVFERTETPLDDLVLEKTRRPFSWLVWMVATYFALRMLNFPNHVNQGIDLVAKTLGIFLVAWVLFRVVDVGIFALKQFTEETESKVDKQLVPVLRRILRLCLVLFAVLVAIQQWGYNVSSLIAGLGIGGLAFALAARSMLSNWFGALMIFTDRPFEIGQWVETEYGTGEVEEVGLRSTRIRPYGRERVVVPNSDMASGAVTNLSVHDRREITAELDLVYSTSHAQMLEILEEIRSLLAEHEAIFDEDWRAFFTDFGDHALRLEVSCFTEDPDLGHWRAVRQELYLEFMRIVEEAGTEFAYPTQSIVLENAASQPALSQPALSRPAQEDAEPRSSLPPDSDD